MFILKILSLQWQLIKPNLYKFQVIMSLTILAINSHSVMGNMRPIMCHMDRQHWDTTVVTPRDTCVQIVEKDLHAPPTSLYTGGSILERNHSNVPNVIKGSMPNSRYSGICWFIWMKGYDLHCSVEKVWKGSISLISNNPYRCWLWNG